MNIHNSVFFIEFKTKVKTSEREFIKFDLISNDIKGGKKRSKKPTPFF